MADKDKPNLHRINNDIGARLKDNRHIVGREPNIRSGCRDTGARPKDNSRATRSLVRCEPNTHSGCRDTGTRPKDNSRATGSLVRCEPNTHSGCRDTGARPKDNSRAPRSLVRCEPNTHSGYRDAGTRPKDSRVGCEPNICSGCRDTGARRKDNSHKVGSRVGGGDRSDARFERIRIKRKKEADLSLYVSWALDKLGYSSKMRQFRRGCYCLNDQMFNIYKQGTTTLITAGSKGEGLTSCYENDTDQMYVDNHTVCVEQGVDTRFSDTVTVTIMETEHCSPGYSQLRLYKQGTNLNNCSQRSKCILESLFPAGNGNIYLSSAFYNEAIVEYYRNYENTRVNYGLLTGPAIPRSRGMYKADVVYAFRCICPHIIQCWISRPQPHNWPPVELLHQVSQYEAQIVATGCKGSESNYREWRICFITTEKLLLCSLNDTQIKLYILLKYFRKHVLSFVCEEISSYLMKNIVFWMAELYPQEMFAPDVLLKCLSKALSFLRKVIVDNYFPYYMIPGRNLLEGRLSIYDRILLSRLLTNMIKHRKRVLLTLGRLTYALTTIQPNVLIYYEYWRDELEILELLRGNIELSYRTPGSTDSEMEYRVSNDETRLSILCRMCDIVWPEWRNRIHRADIIDYLQYKRQLVLS